MFLGCLMAVLCLMTACQNPSSDQGAIDFKALEKIITQTDYFEDVTQTTTPEVSIASPTPEPMESPDNSSVVYLLKRARKNELLGYTGFALTQYQKVLTIDPENSYAKCVVNEYSIQARIDQEIDALTRQNNREKKIWDDEIANQERIRIEIDSIRKRQHEMDAAFRQLMNAARITRNRRKRAVYLLRAERLKDEYERSKERIALLESHIELSVKKMHAVRQVIDQYHREVEKIRVRNSKPKRVPFPYDEESTSPPTTPVNTPKPIYFDSGVYRNY